MGRTIIIGDVHGCAQEFADLVERLHVTEKDQVILVGDLIVKGPDNAGVIDLAMQLNAKAVRGNHDERCIQWWQAKNEDRDKIPKMSTAHFDACAQLREPHWRYLQSLPYFIELPEHKALVVHAGLEPFVALPDQSIHNLISMRSILADGTVSKRIHHKPWAEVWPGPTRVFFGHDAMRGLQQTPFAVGLDTGCVYGNQLSAAVLDEGQSNYQIVQVEARQAWCPI